MNLQVKYFDGMRTRTAPNKMEGKYGYIFTFDCDCKLKLDRNSTEAFAGRGDLFRSRPCDVQLGV